jgi:RNA polymerase sigma-70 factor (ECF subfamily)
VKRTLAGCREAYRWLVEAYEPAVFGLCRRLLGGDRSEAEDLSQETFLRAYRYLPALADPQRFGPWLYRIARSLCRDRRRRAEAERRAVGERAELARREERERRRSPGGGDDQVASLLAELPADERRVLHLRYFDGLPYEEIVKEMDLSFSKVDHLIRKARARLARRLAVRESVESR